MALDTAMDLANHGFDSIDSLDPGSSRQNTGNKVQDVADPKVILTDGDLVNQHASEGGYTPVIGETDPYQATGAPGEAFNGGGPA